MYQESWRSVECRLRTSRLGSQPQNVLHTIPRIAWTDAVIPHWNGSLAMRPLKIWIVYAFGASPLVAARVSASVYYLLPCCVISAGKLTGDLIVVTGHRQARGLY